MNQIFKNLFKLQTSIPGFVLLVSSGIYIYQGGEEFEAAITGIIAGIFMMFFAKNILSDEQLKNVKNTVKRSKKVPVILLPLLVGFYGYGQKNDTFGEIRVENIYPLSKLCASQPAYCNRDKVKLAYNEDYQITVNDTLLIAWINSKVNPYDTAGFVTWPDTLNRIATKWQIDTTSTRIDAIVQTAIFWPDTLTKIATTWQIDTTSTRIQTIANTALFWPDTLTKIATKYQLDTLTIPAATTPGGSSTQLQYNNAGSFGGIPGSVFDGTNLTISAGYFQQDDIRLNSNIITAQSSDLQLQSGTVGGDVVVIDNLRPDVSNSLDIGESSFAFRDMYLFDDWNTSGGSSTTAFIEDTSVYALIKKHAPSATPAGVGTELQYRNGSNFGAVTGSTWNGSRLGLTANVSFNNVIPFSGNEVTFDTPDNNTLSVGNNTFKYYGSSDWLELSGIDGYLYTRGYLYSYDVNQYHFNDTSFQELVEKYAPVASTPNLDQVMEAGSTASVTSAISITSTGGNIGVSGVDINLASTSNINLTPTGETFFSNRFSPNSTSDYDIGSNLFRVRRVYPDTIGTNTNLYIEGSDVNINTLDNSSAYDVIINDTTLIDLIIKHSPQGVSSGVYTPTLSGSTNVTSSTPLEFMWQRIGDIVTVNGTIQITFTSTSTPFSFDLSLPVASNFTSNLNDCSGSVNFEFIDSVGSVTADISGDNAQCGGTIGSTATLQEVYFQFTYQVL